MNPAQTIVVNTTRANYPIFVNVFGLYLGNLLFYVTGVVLLLQGGAAIARMMHLGPSAVRILLAIGAVVFAPSLASLGHLLVIVPFFLYPMLYRIAPWLLPWNVALSILSAIGTVWIYHRRLRKRVAS